MGRVAVWTQPSAGREWLTLCLRFANTVEWHAGPSPTEGLRTYADLAAWAVQAGLLTRGDARRLGARAEARPRQARQVLTQAVAIREVIYRVLARIAHGRGPAPDDLAAFNEVLGHALRPSRLVASRERFAWQVAGPEDALDRMLWPVLRSAADLLTSEDLHRVKQCADDRGCGWLFLDRSKNLSRRWCSMQGCGNRAKALQHYLRRRRQKER